MRWLILKICFVLFLDRKILTLLNFKVHLLRLSSGGSELLCEGLFSHPNEIWDLASSPFDQRIFSTVFSTGNSHHLETSNFELIWSKKNRTFPIECIKFQKLKLQCCQRRITVLLFSISRRLIWSSNMADSWAIWSIEFFNIGMCCFPWCTCW